MENFILAAISIELRKLLLHQRLGKIFQLGTTGLLIETRLREHGWLYLSTDPQHLALHLTNRNAKQFHAEARIDTQFVLLFKKYLGNALITEIEKLGYDRMVKISFVATDENGVDTPRELIIQLTGRSANVFILEKNHILIALREHSFETGIYVEPFLPNDKLDPFYCTPEQLQTLIETHEGDVTAAAASSFFGFGTQLAEELSTRAKNLPADEALTKLLNEAFLAESFSPAVYSTAPLPEMKQQIGREDFFITYSSIEFQHQVNRVRTNFDSINQAADAANNLIEARRNFIQTKQTLTTELNTRLKKQTTLQKNFLREQAGFSRFEEHQKFGELLLSNLHQAIKSGSSFVVTDYYDPEQAQLSIPAKEFSTPKELAEHYFKSARKARHGIETINARLPEVEASIVKINQQLERLKTISTFEELNKCQEEIGTIQRGAMQRKTKAASPKEKQNPISGARRYQSSDGYEILVGRTSKDNDNLTLRVAKSFDLWFHAADYPGSHVILRNKNKTIPIPVRSITEAAQLAAKFSQANVKGAGGARIGVNYCEKKFVSKPKGFGVGQVRLSSYKTIIVEPIEAAERIL
jgi:predicted ribosome quality control (RQC) complex YloA/Tae2 family protein